MAKKQKNVTMCGVETEAGGFIGTHLDVDYEKTAEAALKAELGSHKGAPRTRAQLLEYIQSLHLELARIRETLQRERTINKDQDAQLSNLCVENRWMADEIDAMKKASAAEVAVHREVIAQLLNTYRYKGRQLAWQNEKGEEIRVKMSTTVGQSVQNQANLNK